MIIFGVSFSPALLGELEREKRRRRRRRRKKGADEEATREKERES